LNGFIRDLQNDPERFASLVPGDLVLMDFVGSDVPQNGRLGFIHNQDSIFEYLDEVLGQRTMAAIKRDALNEILNLTRTAADHPMRTFAKEWRPSIVRCRAGFTIWKWHWMLFGIKKHTRHPRE